MMTWKRETGDSDLEKGWRGWSAAEQTKLLLLEEGTEVRRGEVTGKRSELVFLGV